jgi:signal transduction histidine kinase
LLLHLTAVLALAVSVLHGFIGLYVVPKLARLADRTSGLIRAAQYGAAAFFVGCAMTHIALAEHMLAVPELVRGHEWAHMLPHIAQVLGGATFALIAWRKLDVRLLTKDEARFEAESERLREQLERSQRLNGLGQLAGGVAHDFNNLLAVIGGYARLLDRRLADRPDLRAEAGELVDLRVILVREAPPVALGRGRIEQILLNLTLNASDAMPAGGKLTIRTDVIDTGVRLTVEDTGEGMTPDVAAHAFDPFFTTKGEGKGTGLGLSVVYGIVERAGGRIDLDSTLGAGTRLTLDLPLAEVAVPEDPAPGGAAGSLRGVTVLVVDDQRQVRELAARILEQHDARVVGAADGREALTAFAEHEDEIDVVLTDIVMPAISGIELARRLRNDRPGLPLVYFSGHAGDVELPDEGALLQKPFTPEQLVSAIGDVLPARFFAGR